MEARRSACRPSLYPSMSAETREEAHQPARPLAEQFRRIETAGGALADLAEGGVGRDHIGDSGQLDPATDRQTPELNELARMGADDGGAENSAIAPRHRLDEPMRLAFGLCPVILVKRPAQHLKVAAMRFPRFAFRHARLRKLGIRIGDPGKGAVIDLRRQAEERAANDDAGMIARDMGELRPAGSITCGVDPRIRGA